MADIQNITYSYSAYRKELSAYGITFADDKDTINSLSQILLSSVPTKEKINQLKVLLNTGNDKAAAGAITLMTGGMTDLRLFFPEAYEDAEKTDGKVKFSDGSDFDEVKLDLEAFLSAEEMKLVTAARQIYDWMQMKKLLGSEKSFTDAFVASYDAHRSDLTELKKLCKELKPYDKDIYQDIFFDKTRKDGYAAYIGMGYNPKNQCRFTCEAADFYGFLTKRLMAAEERTDLFSAQIGQILAKAEEGKFLPKQRKKIRDTDTLLEYLQKKYEDPVILREKVLLLPSIRLGGILYQIRSINGVGTLRLVHAEPFTISGSDRYEVIFRAAELVKNESRFSHYAKRHNITAGENIMLYKNFLEEYEERYSGRLNNMLDKLKSHLDDFSNLPVTTQCIVIRNLFGLTASGSTSMADLTALKEAVQAGAINISNASLSNFTLVEMSSTGLFTKETAF